MASRMKAELLDENLTRVCGVLSKLLDHDIFPWLNSGGQPTRASKYSNGKKGSKLSWPQNASIVTVLCSSIALKQRPCGLLGRT